MDITSPLVGTIVKIGVARSQQVTRGDELMIIESMKMEHPIVVDRSGTVAEICVTVGQTVIEGQLLIQINETASAQDVLTQDMQPQVQLTSGIDRQIDADKNSERSDLAAYRKRRAQTHDDNRTDAVVKRHARGQRTARENIADLVDKNSFSEYGSFAVAAQRGRRTEDELISTTPADGLVCGIASINGNLFNSDKSRCAVLSYDYMVLAGTQGFINHRKKDRLFDIAQRLQLPVVLFAEGGGGRPGDTDAPGVAGLDVMSFAAFAKLSGLVPLIGIASGYCFAGNAALLGCCDVIIATENSNIGMAGPAMVLGGGLGTVAPTAIGPIATQSKNGVVDIRVADEQAAVTVAQRYLSYFQGTTSNYKRHDDELLRNTVPEQRTRIYDVRKVVELLCDIDSLLELRAEFGVGIITALGRIEGKPVGVVANNPSHLGGAIDVDGADKMARFIQLCDAFDIPLISLCDTPGFMVGVDAEEGAQVRHFARLFVTAASVTIPWLTVVLRKGYGLGAQAMAGGSFHAKEMIVAWPTGEFGGMGLEGAVRLGYKRELDATANLSERNALEQRLIAQAYERGGALNMASHTEIDDVIDPADTRSRLISILRACPIPQSRNSKKRPMIDTW